MFFFFFASLKETSVDELSYLWTLHLLPVSMSPKRNRMVEYLKRHMNNDLYKWWWYVDNCLPIVTSVALLEKEDERHDVSSLFFFECADEFH